MMNSLGMKLGTVALIAALTMTGCGNYGGQKTDTANTTKPENTVTDSGKPAITIKASHGDPESSPRHKGLAQFAKTVDEKSQGRIKVTIYPNGQLSNGNNQTMIEQLQTGTLQMATVSNLVFSNFEKKFGALSLPFLFNDRQKAYNAVDGPVGTELLSTLEAKGIQGVGYWEGGFRQITNSKKAIATPEDLQGLKIRVPEITMYQSLYKKLGATATPMAFGELFSAMEQKVVDGQENPLVTIDSAKFQEVQKHVTIWDYSWDALIVGFNKKFWDGLDDESKKIITDAVKEAGTYERGLVAQGDKDLIDKLAKDGMTVTQLSDQQKQAFRAKVADVYKEVESEYIAELIDKLVEAAK
ncbi:TRAP transporter substrate-binding protein [Paenibacillus xerothermodurans]|uniref:C4-dicarboxylate ABC transporter substrate-binding protein n=1 Tax=Paenibacillus xerothermodurans TaxID=1977292 RepID=A0A2W1NW73_PAEXE|nr:TRAP transporter substrate-binding protein [Paenibacillus xerothermodurans]PZE22793.1 C4-dicarboxylate ABC transporter substrate-binding protein [Paenibacillus xerothermodurans]